MDVNEHERLSNFTCRHKLKERNTTFIAVLHFAVTCMQNSTIEIGNTHLLRFDLKSFDC